MAAFAAHALALGSQAALLVGKPGAGPVQAGAADSPFAAMLAQMMAGTSLQGAPTAISGSLPANATTAAQPQTTTSALTTPVPSFFAILPGNVPSYAQSLGTSQPAPSADVTPPTRQSAAAFAPMHGFTSAQASAYFSAPGFASTNSSSAMSGNVTPAAQNPAQQAASSWLRQMMAAGPSASASGYPGAPPPLSSDLPSGVASYTGPMGASTTQLPGSSPVNALNTQSGSQQTGAALIEQMIAAGQHTGVSSGTAAPSNPPTSLPAGVAGYAQALNGTSPQIAGAPATASGFISPSASQQTPASLLQQMISASVRVSSSSIQAAPVGSPNLPANVASYGQSMNAVPPLFAGASAANLMTLRATGVPQLQSIAQSAAPTAPSQTTQNASSQSPAAQPAASASAGPWLVPSPPSTILSADSTQSVAAMFGVPAFPAAMAYAPASAGKAQSASQGNQGDASSQVINATKNGTAASVLTAATPGNTAQAAQPATAQSPQSTVAGNQTPSAPTESSKAATLAQAAEDSVRQAHAAPVTEAQTLPLQFDLADTKAGSKPDGSHTTGGSDNETHPLDATESSEPASQPVPSASPQHSQTLPSPAPSLPAAGDAQAPSAPTIAGAQISAGSGQQQPQTMTATLPPAQTAMAPAAPDLNQLALSIAAKSSDGAKQFDIRLDPAELGRVDVRLSVDSSGTAQAHLAAERPETLALLQSNAGTLTRALQDSGVQVASNGLQFSLKGQERQTEGQQRAPTRSRNSAAPSIAAIGAMNGALPIYSLSPTGAGVNILV